MNEVIRICFRYYGLRKISTPTAVRSGTGVRGGKRGQDGRTAGNNNNNNMTGIRPIITVTEFTPGTTPDKVSSSDGSNRDENEPLIQASSAAVGNNDVVAIRVPSVSKKSTSASRSRTDSLVSYTQATTSEAPGSTFYINRKGEIDFTVLLKVSIVIL